MDKEPQFIYFRQCNGLAYQCLYEPTLTIAQLLRQILSTSVPNYLKPISKGRLLQIDHSLADNNLKPNQIIHLLALARAPEQKGFIYLSFQNKIHRIEFNADQQIKQLKQKIYLETGLEECHQLILFNSIQLQKGKKIKDYEMRSGDFLCMARNIQTKNVVFDLPQVIFPKKHSIEKRRGSECMHKLELANSSHRKTNEPAEIRHQQQTKVHQVSTSNMMSPSLIYGPSPLSQCDFTSFRASMDNWIGRPSNVPEESFDENNSFVAKDGFRMYQNSQIEQTGNYKIELSNPSLHPQIVLCESLNYGDDNLSSIDQLSPLGKQTKQTNQIHKIIPKFTISTNLQQSQQKQMKTNNTYKLNLINLITKNKLKVSGIINRDYNKQCQKQNLDNEIKACQKLKNLICDLELIDHSQVDLQFYRVQGEDSHHNKLSESEIQAMLKLNGCNNTNKDQSKDITNQNQDQISKREINIGYKILQNTQKQMNIKEK